MITVGIDSYVSVSDADIFFSKKYNSEGWFELTTGDKERLLSTATKKIDRLLLKGRKKVYTQVLAFPRLYRHNRYSEIQSYQTEDIPEVVKSACCVEAFALCDTDFSKRRSLQEQGVKSFSLGSLSETFQDCSPEVLLSKEAKEYLRGWVLRAVRIS